MTQSLQVCQPSIVALSIWLERNVLAVRQAEEQVAVQAQGRERGSHTHTIHPEGEVEQGLAQPEVRQAAEAVAVLVVHLVVLAADQAAVFISPATS